MGGENVTATQQEVRWIGEGSARRKSMLPWIKDEVIYYAHQTEGIRKLARMKSFILGDEMGLGKSLQALSVFAIDIELKRGDTALVVCPLSLKDNWLDEVEKYTGGIFAMKLNGTPAKRLEQIEFWKSVDQPKILVINYKQVVSHFDILNSIGFHLVIFDEAHTIKNPKAQVTKCCLKLRATRSFMLTGTPLLNRVNELWAPLNRIDPVKFKSFWNFTHRFCVYGGYGGHEIIGTKNEQELKNILAQVMVRRLKKDVLDLPSVQVIERRVRLLPEQRKLYDQVEKELMLEINGEESELDNALTKMLRLKQICGTTLPFTGEDKSSKLDMAVEENVELVDSGNHVVIFTQFRDVQAACAARLEDAGVKVYLLNGDVPGSDRVKVVKAWESDKPCAIVCMLQVAGVGLNMTKARHVTMLDKLYVPGLNQQAIDRLHRIGASTTQSIQVFDYYCIGTVESRVNQILKIKTQLGQDIIEGVQDSVDFRKKLIAAAMERGE